MPEPMNDIITLNAALREAQAENDWLRNRNRALATLVLTYEIQRAQAAEQEKEPTE